MSPAPLSVTKADLDAARGRIAPHIYHTPVLRSRQIDQLLGAQVFFKAEVFQRSGAFKARGAFSRALLLSEAERRRGMVAFSSGNHAQAVALASRELSIPATIVMPLDAPAVKVAATRAYGAEVVFYDRAAGQSREDLARHLVQQRGGVLVPPFDDDAVIAGQGTLGLELLEDEPDLDVIVVPCGGGGLLSGVAVAARALRPSVRLFGVEPEAGDDMRRSVAAGQPVSIAVPETICDSLRTTAPAERTLRIVRELVDEILLVSDLEIRRAMALVLSRLKVVVEPGGVAGFAALVHRKVPNVEGRRVGVVLSGGNIDPEALGELMAGLSKKRREATAEVPAPSGLPTPGLARGATSRQDPSRHEPVRHTMPEPPKGPIRASLPFPAFQPTQPIVPPAAPAGEPLAPLRAEDVIAQMGGRGPYLEVGTPAPAVEDPRFPSSSRELELDDPWHSPEGETPKK